MTLATWITISRLFALPFLLYGLQDGIAENFSARWICLAIFIVAASTDWLDGYLARKFDQVTDLGKFLDPLVDKLLILGPLIALVELGQIPAWSVVIILTRELAIAGWRVQQTQISGANWWGKVKTVLQIIAVSFLIAPLSGVWVPVSLGIYAASICLTVVSGIVYILPQSPSVQ
ncbi:CDP-diacylglycerol--glycerol-3-phosphate 3-phosphatidyltransferase [Acaryochloris marina]|uniref:CDP-diacylglycerol--glycerol-3-phosphate 3-phosphatidyltransferase n=1 Tax=Acaryochloris marina (strain MBIC 11017) TaxID=329726 RepID=B0CC39_ACAM1|nr:CDP-diacylglycerol--glycerol-3-phosphate 3-phosphatidyltransferase [Acaryochloris marina]ABW25581.1 CDP-diacylglycerol--glycerol-3-phosphate 3-phosphatidyltransferase [Acaryochloris marina MBIC11017]BDM80460.1 CDP-diacylglycerol--glycerol-3-phosphate 3-phosphatidyltransferase [Acaryochloris marina MBIC10699]